MDQSPVDTVFFKKKDCTKVHIFSFKVFLSSFVPLFVAIDAIGMVTVYLSLTEALETEARRRLVTEATLTALGVSLVFLAFGRIIFRLLGITEFDFRIGGGIVLLVLAIVDLLFSQQARRGGSGDSVGVVPIGIPLIMGPAALTTILISVDAVGIWMSLISLLANLGIVWLIFRYAEWAVKLMGPAG